jgi:DNA-binding transcriptional LysR family regulator
MSRKSAQPSPISSNRFTLRQLEAFTAVAQQGTVSSAAVSLSRTQSAVSMALQELEASLGCELFERYGRRLHQTDTARGLLPRAVEIVDRAREIAEFVTSESSAQSQVALGASRTVGPIVMPELIARCQRDNLAPKIHLTVANSEQLVSQIHGFTLDCAFVEGNVDDPSLRKQAWLDDQLCLFARADHPIFSSRARLANKLSESQWVLREPGSGSREIFLRALAPIVAEPVIALELNDPETQKRCVTTSDWLSCISRRAIRDELKHGSLREITGVPKALKDALTRRFWIVTHPERFETQALARVLNAARSM